jgi:UDP-glucose 4-epimerase
MKTILATGGAGYIGSHFVNKAKEHYRIIVADNFRESRKNIIKHENISYSKTDIRDADALFKIFKKNKIDLVVHYAALASVPGSLETPEEYYETNIKGGLNLLSAMMRTGVKKIIFSSSASVYGEPISEIISENHPKNPTNPYGRTKLMFEEILKDYHAAYGIHSISFRYFCASGCDESGKIGEYHTPENHVIPAIIETLLGKRDKFYVCGNDYNTKDGTGIRDYIHVNDLAEAHLSAGRMLLSGEPICEQLNLGINKGFSVLELIAATEKISGKKLACEFTERRPGDPSRLIANADRAQEFLHWQPRYTDISEIIKTVYDFWTNPAFLKTRGARKK